MEFQTIVLGLGVMGSATAYQLAKRGVQVLALDQFRPPHTFGSSHGDTRISRLAIGEGEHCTPFSIRTHEIWREMEDETGRELLTITGGLIISSAARTCNNSVKDFFAGTLRAARQFNIEYESLDSAGIRRRFPQFNVRDGESAYFELNAGFARPEACVSAQLELAAKYGATLHLEERALSFRQQGETVLVRTNRDEYKARKLIVTAGPWLPILLNEEMAQHFTVMRQVLFWFDPKRSVEEFHIGKFPVFIWEPQGTPQAIYGFPAIDGPHGGVKVSTSQYKTTTTADSVRRDVDPDEINWMYTNLVEPCLPGLSKHCLKTVTCLYTVTRDFGFVIDTHPQFSNVILASPCSGKGFKFSAAIGEALAELAVRGKSTLDLGKFGLKRFEQFATAK